MPRFTLTIDLGNSEMSGYEDISAALHDAADRIARDYLDSGRVRDVNGNTVGKWSTK